MSSWRWRSYISGPLVTGQTRISSSLASTEDRCHAVDKRRVDARPDRQIPEARVGEGETFYRILLRHQDGGCPRKARVVGRVTMVIGKGMANRIEPQAAQLGEEAIGIADARHGVDRPPAPCLEVGRLR